MARFSIVLGIVAAVTALTFIVATGWTAEASHAGGMDLMAIDMDPTNAPANTNASIGTIEICARINKNAIQDADEDAVDRIDIDIVAGNVPVGFEMSGFAFDLSYPSSSLFVAGRDFTSFMINRISGSVGVDVSDILPDSDGSFTGGAIDFGNGPVHESGDGTLMRVTLETAATPPQGVYPLTLTSNVHVDSASNMHSPDVTQNATVAVDTPCPSGPTPTATPAPTPTPTPTPGPTPTASPTATPTPTPSPAPMALSESQSPAPTHTPAPAALPAVLPPTGAGPATGDGTALALLLLLGGTLITAGAWVARKNENHT